MIEIKITGEKPLEALSLIALMSKHVSRDPEVVAAAEALENRKRDQPVKPIAEIKPAIPAPTQTSVNPTPTAAPTSNFYAAAPKNPQMPPVAAPAPAAANVPMPPAQGVTAPSSAPTAVNPAPTAPVAPPPTYTIAQLQQACAPLMDAGKQAELVNLLRSFGVQALTQLPKERLGEFATALRGLGAQI